MAGADLTKKKEKACKEVEKRGKIKGNGVWFYTTRRTTRIDRKNQKG